MYSQPVLTTLLVRLGKKKVMMETLTTANKCSVNTISTAVIWLPNDRNPK